MLFFHQPENPIFSLHRVHESNLQRLFLILPEWFAYMEEHKITYLDLDSPSCSRRFDPHIIEESWGSWKGIGRFYTAIWGCSIGSCHGRGFWIS